MKKLLLILLCVSLYLTAFSQNGGQYFENQRGKLRKSGDTVFYINKQSCSANFRTVLNNVEIIYLIPSGDSIIRTASTIFEAKMKPIDNCNNPGGDMGWLEIPGWALPVYSFFYDNGKLHWTASHISILQYSSNARNWINIYQSLNKEDQYSISKEGFYRVFIDNNDYSEVLFIRIKDLHIKNNIYSIDGKLLHKKPIGLIYLENGKAKMIIQ